MEPLVSEGTILLCGEPGFTILVNGNDLYIGIAEAFMPARADTREMIELPGRYRVTVERIG